MPSRQVIVDGSNLATEGRSLPSLTQLDQAVREYLSENPTDVVTVVVDASFGHRIDPTEVPMFEEAEVAGELVSPPAGAIGRGDAFLLRIAEKTGATVLSNDSFQEFHGEHSWLFDDGRLVGGKPVPGVGWIFLPRAPVRGQRSRDVVKEAKRRKRADDVAEPASRESGLDLAASRAKGRAKKVDRAIARATEEAVEPKEKGRRRRRAAGVPPAEAVNEPLAFITFIAAHPLGSEVVGTVLEFSSHGAFVSADGARCYLPLSAMGDPPPRRAREVLAKGEERAFVIQALDPQRRGIELALPGFARVAGGPTEETVEAEIHPRVEAAPKPRRRGKTEAAAADGAPPVEAATPSPVVVENSRMPEPTAAATPARRGGGSKAVPSAPAAAGAEADAQDGASGPPLAGPRSQPRRAASVKKAPAEKAAAPAKKAPAKKAAAKVTPTRAAGAKKAAAKKAGSAEKVTGTRAKATPTSGTAAKTLPAKASAEPTPAKRTRREATPAQTRAAKATAAGATSAQAPPAKATPAKATTAKAATAKATRKAAPLENPASPGEAAPNASAPGRTTPARRTTTKATANAPDVAAGAER